MGKIKHICKYCGKHFEDYFNTTKYCSRDCMFKDRTKSKEVVCPICKKIFKQKHPRQIYCSVGCRNQASRKRIECVCENCGKVFMRKKSEVEKNKHHFCSRECKKAFGQWPEYDKELLKKNYGKFPMLELASMLSIPRTSKDINREAIRLGITNSKNWTEEEVDILKSNYSKCTIDELLILLPNRTACGIHGKAVSCGLKSKYYIDRRYTDEEINFLKENYLKMSNEELADKLNRGADAIGQRLWKLGLIRPKDKIKYENIAIYIRGRLMPWINQQKRECNYTCAITGKRSNIILHHIYSFNKILTEAIESLNFPILEDINLYNENQLNTLYNKFIEIQLEYDAYICITESIHKEFHSLYGYGNNTPEQWDEFIKNYQNKIA